MNSQFQELAKIYKSTSQHNILLLAWLLQTE